MKSELWKTGRKVDRGFDGMEVKTKQAKQAEKAKRCL